MWQKIENWRLWKWMRTPTTERRERHEVGRWRNMPIQYTFILYNCLYGANNVFDLVLIENPKQFNERANTIGKGIIFTEEANDFVEIKWLKAE